MANTNSPFRDAWLKLERAKKHIEELKAEVQAFHASNPYEIFQERNPKNDYLVVKVRRLKHPPESLVLVAGDAIHNTRVALDYLACDLALRNGKSTKQVYFPFAKTREDFGSSGVQRKIRNLSTADQEVIRALEPYLGGKGELLFALHDLDRVEKHINLVTLGAAGNSLEVKPKIADRMRLYKPSPFDDRDEIPIVGFPPGVDFEGEIRPSIVICFADPKPVRDQPVGGMLDSFVNTVSDIIELF